MTEYCPDCKDHEECRATGCSNPRRHPMQKPNVNIKSHNSVVIEQEDYVSFDNSICSYPIRWRWSDHHSDAQWLEVLTVDGWAEVYPIIKRTRRL